MNCKENLNNIRKIEIENTNSFNISQKINDHRKNSSKKNKNNKSFIH